MSRSVGNVRARGRLWVAGTTVACGLVGAAGSAGVGCGREDVVLVRPPSVAAPRVPAGATFEAVLERDLGPATSVAGDLFVARLAQPLRAAEETIVAPKGSMVVGRVVDARGRDDPSVEPSVTIVFERIVTETRAFPILGRVLSAGRGVALWSAPSTDASAGWHSVIRPLDGADAPVDGGGAVGGGPRASREVLVPAGTHLRVLLLRPVQYP